MTIHDTTKRLDSPTSWVRIPYAAARVLGKAGLRNV